MDILGWTLLWLVCNFLVSIIAAKRGRSGAGAFFTVCFLTVLLAVVVSYGLGNNMQAKDWALPLVAWLVLGGGLLWALTAPNEAKLAEERGEFGNLKRCPFCAEAIKREAIKCKHCGSALADNSES